MKLTEAALKKLILEVLGDDENEEGDEESTTPAPQPTAQPAAPKQPEKNKIRWSPFIPQDVRKFGSPPFDPSIIFRSTNPTKKLYEKSGRKFYVRFAFNSANIDLSAMKAQQDKTIGKHRRRQRVINLAPGEALFIYDVYQPYEQVKDYRDKKKGDYGEMKVTLRLPDWAYDYNEEEGWIDISQSFLRRQSIKLIDEDGNFIDNMGRVYLTYYQHKKLANATKFVPFRGRKRPTRKDDESGNPI